MDFTYWLILCGITISMVFIVDNKKGLDYLVSTFDLTFMLLFVSWFYILVAAAIYFQGLDLWAIAGYYLATFPGWFYAKKKLNKLSETTNYNNSPRELPPEQVEAHKKSAIEAQKRKEKEDEVRRSLLIPDEYISTFLLHAEKRYNKVDKYGNRDKEALDKEIIEYMGSITKRTVEDSHTRMLVMNSVNAFAQGRSYPKLSPDYQWLNAYLRKVFVENMKNKEAKIKNGEINIDTMIGIEFEQYLARIFENADYTIGFTPESGDQGADIIAEKGDRKLIIQAKRYKSSVGNGAVQEVIGAIGYYEGTEGWVITNSVFTSSAIELARKNNIRLIDGSKLSKLSKLI